MDSIFIGNSSSGMIEAPALKIPSINIGDRQKGRIRINSIVDCDPSEKSISAALETISNNSFQSGLENMKIPFEKPDTSKIIKKLLEKADLRDIMKKDFFDMNIN